MRAKEFLSRAWCIELQVQAKQQQIESLRSMASLVRTCMGNTPVNHTRNVTSMQDTVARILEEEEELNRRIDALVAVKVEVGLVIDRVEDAILRLILEKRYLLFQSWDRIAEDFGRTERWAQFNHAKALHEVQGILDGME